MGVEGHGVVGIFVNYQGTDYGGSAAVNVGTPYLVLLWLVGLIVGAVVRESQPFQF